MTGLDLKKDHIIEIAVIITDGHLNIIAEGPNLIIHQPKSLLDSMDSWCQQHHGESGLTKAVLESKLTMSEAEQQILDFIKQYIPTPKIAPLAGNSVYVDRLFLRKDMPILESYLHYRIVDVSSIKELIKRWYPNLSIPKKQEQHR
jgi:oligoribonuclease